ncbi:low molecular weight protein-tyrosine-phosphatase [Neptunomonas antarctica]|uniref:protein-tyrosine-phosphatase n=1 Tax=Neptunomonas antarctica TaxID=619304 RepID=A0A1N7KAU6_9GAMM|nr:low molecular weight protein-tyrosine-phosphatase [Neptunomonas antarctica]SIS58630.1 protein tyrosine phosphatase [Neptunomonas antarctica]
MKINNKSRVLFVCLGNICRSPTAHGVFETLVAQQGMAALIDVDSAGTAAYHVGNSPDARSVSAAQERGYQLNHLRARQAVPQDFAEFTHILAMDEENLSHLKTIAPPEYQGHLGLFMDFAQCVEREVPDPYYGGNTGFEQVLDLVENASMGLIIKIQQERR